MQAEGPVGFWKEWSAGRWEPETHAALECLLTPESTYLDIGAWIGPTVLWAVPLCKRVVAVEPDPVAFYDLCHNLGEWANVSLINAAVAPVSGGSALYHRGAFGDSMSSLVPTGEDAIDVDTITPVDLFVRHDVTPPAVCKVDIEGGEALVLPDLVPLLIERDMPLILSVHERWMPPGGLSSVNDALGDFSSVTQLCDSGGGMYELLCLSTKEPRWPSP